MAEAPDINVDELRRRARRRLLGAIVLALGAAVIVPMLLENDPKPLGDDVSVKIPPEDNAKFVNRLSDKGAKPAVRGDAAKSETAKEPAKETPKEPLKESTKESAKAEPPPVSAPPSSTPTPPASSEPSAAGSNGVAPKKSIAQAEQKMLGSATKSAPPPTATPPTSPAVAPAPAPAEATPASADAPREGFSVQLAAFADDKGANALANKLKRAAYPAYTEPLKTSKGTLWRVRVGPYPSREAAADVRDKLKGEGYSGIVAAAK